MTDSLLRPTDEGGRPDVAPTRRSGTATRPGAVVVGVDDGPLPWGLLEQALLVALERRAPMVVVHVHGPGSPRATWSDDAAVRAGEHLARAASLPVSRRCVGGDPVEALAAAADPGGVIVLGDRHRRVGSAAGTTLDAVVEVAPCPVLVVDESAPPLPPDGGVVVGVDGSPDAPTVLRHAMLAAHAMATGVRAVSTWTELDGGPVTGTGDLLATVGREVATVPVVLEQVEDRAGRRLLAEGRDAALLVIGHRHPSASGLRGRGSTARTVLAAPPCPVLVLGPRVLDAATVEGRDPAGAGGPDAAGPPAEGR